MRMIIFGGFLGSGKTTILMRIAQFLIRNSRDDRKNKVVILENEIGQVGVDDMLLKSNGYTVNELFAGCACCTMSGELRGNVKVILREMDPEWLILEATGIAYPLNIKETLDPIIEIPAVIVSVVDAHRFLRMLTPLNDLIVSQLKDAKYIFVNKIDLVTAEITQEVKARVKDIAPLAQIQPVSGLAPIASDVLEDLVRVLMEGSKSEK